MREYDCLMGKRVLGLSANTVGMSEQESGGMMRVDGLLREQESLRTITATMR